jgi:ABC-type transport system involved in Fe-S cluster assembly fused permease/ATPase subunit
MDIIKYNIFPICLMAIAVLLIYLDKYGWEFCVGAAVFVYLSGYIDYDEPGTPSGSK